MGELFPSGDEYFIKKLPHLALVSLCAAAFIFLDFSVDSNYIYGMGCSGNSVCLPCIYPNSPIIYLDYTRDVTVKQKVGEPSLIARFAHIFIVIVISFGRTDLVSISCLLIWFIQNIC